MNITDVRVYPLTNSRVLALASITFDECFVVTQLRILNGRNGLFVSMPSNKGKDGEYHDIVFPITKESREQIQTKVLAKYNEGMSDEAREVSDTVEKYNERKKYETIDVDEDDLPF